MTLLSTRQRLVGFGLSAIAVLLRMASDWIFPSGGPFSYQLLQAAFLLLALLVLWPHLDTVFLKGGNTWSAVQEGSVAFPIGLLAGLMLAWLQYGGPKVPSLDQASLAIASNVFFPAVEELEFRGFLLTWLLGRKVPGLLAVPLVAVLHMIAHPHYFWSGNFLSAGLALFLGIWLGWLVCRSRSLWGAYTGHAAGNIALFLPLLGNGFIR